MAASLHDRWPEAEIHWLVNAPYADVLRAHPAIHTVIPFDRKGMGSSSKRFNPLPLLRFLMSLRRADYDITIDAQGLFRSGLFTLATRAKKRIGYANARELGWLGLNERVTVPAGTHTVDKMMALLAPLGIAPTSYDMRLHTPADERSRVQGQDEFNTRYVVLAPTSLWEGKRWPIERFANIARKTAEAGYSAVVVGAPGEESQCEPLLRLAESGLPLVNCVGKTSIAMMMSIIEQARAVVANDSAALHMAVGLNRPVVALFGPTHTDLVGPFGAGESVIQHTKPGDTMDHKNTEAGRELMRRITTEEVWQRLSQLLAD